MGSFRLFPVMFCIVNPFPSLLSYGWIVSSVEFNQCNLQNTAPLQIVHFSPQLIIIPDLVKQIWLFYFN